ncbi:hypothetical protein, conserved [Babesia bigemina]|uniref:Uncharacterized protein n=1 Tax=Babesia bigemina TaxID=5866 RepID=A0A061DEB6_BABBI|nr:hypothetical protein, conserved [Babesia bigemina]CDR97005.1 hypothetical protein, conserved [Babesia bigemina]|eukprot:XP_012769191.1 hypothetical protein, conserved [Babesia bigemina]
MAFFRNHFVQAPAAHHREHRNIMAAEQDTRAERANSSSFGEARSAQHRRFTVKHKLYRSSCKHNASLRLLKLDFLAYHLLLRQPWLVAATKQIPDDGSLSVPGTLDGVMPKRTRRRRLIMTRPDGRARAHIRRYVGANLPDSVHALGSDGEPAGPTSHLRRCHAHFFLDAYLKSVLQNGGMPKAAYFGVFAFVERRLMLYFGGQLPDVFTSGACAHPGESAAEEDLTLQQLATYVQGTENMLHTLSGKPGIYVHLLFIAMLILLRNLRRTLRRHPPTAMLIEFTLLCAEALHCTHEYVHRVCIAHYMEFAHRPGVTVPALPASKAVSSNTPDTVDPDVSAPTGDGEKAEESRDHPPHLQNNSPARCWEAPPHRDEEFKRNRNLLITFRDACMNFKQALTVRGQLAWKEYRDEMDCEVACEQNSEQQRGPDAGDSQPEGTNIDTVYPEVPFSSNVFAEFINVADKLLFQWSIALCRYASEANRVMPNPLLKEYRSLGFGSIAEGPVRLYKKVRGLNLTLHRYKKLAAFKKWSLDNKLTAEPCSEESPKKRAKTAADAMLTWNKPVDEIPLVFPQNGVAYCEPELKTSQEASETAPSERSRSARLNLSEGPSRNDSSRILSFFTSLLGAVRENGRNSRDPSKAFHEPASYGMRCPPGTGEAGDKGQEEATLVEPASGGMTPPVPLNSDADDEWAVTHKQKAGAGNEAALRIVDVAAALQEHAAKLESMLPLADNRANEQGRKADTVAPTTVKQAEGATSPAITMSPAEVSPPSELPPGKRSPFDAFSKDKPLGEASHSGVKSSSAEVSPASELPPGKRSPFDAFSKDKPLGEASHSGVKSSSTEVSPPSELPPGKRSPFDAFSKDKPLGEVLPPALKSTARGAPSYGMKTRSAQMSTSRGAPSYGMKTRSAHMSTSREAPVYGMKTRSSQMSSSREASAYGMKTRSAPMSTYMEAQAYGMKTRSVQMSPPGVMSTSRGASPPGVMSASRGASPPGVMSASRGASPPGVRSPPGEVSPPGETPLAAEMPPGAKPDGIGTTYMNAGLRITVGSSSPPPQQGSVAVGRRRGKWKRDEVLLLIDAINRHGVGRWAYFAATYFGGRRTGMQLKDKWSNLMRYKYVYQDTSARGPNVTERPPWRLVDSF